MASLQHVVFILPVLLFTSKQKTDQGSHYLWELSTTQYQVTVFFINPWKKQLSPVSLKNKEELATPYNPLPSTNCSLSVQHSVGTSVADHDYANFSLQT